MKKFLFFVSCFICNLTMAQNPFFINYGTSEGLPSTNIYSVFQDQNKFLWFTTDAGVVKYDSHSFTLYNTDNGLSDNEVFQMKEDHKGRIWFLTLNGRPSYIYKDKIYNDSNTPFLKKISASNMIMDFYEDDKKNGYFVFRGGEVSVIKPDNTVSKLESAAISLCGIWENNHSFYLLTDGGVFDVSNGKYTSTASNKFHYRMYHSGGRDFYSHVNFLYQIDRDNVSQELVELPEITEIINIYIESPKKLWLCTRNGLFLCENNKFKMKFFGDFSISAMTKDFEGGYWLTTLKKGVLYVPSFEVYEDKLNANTTSKLNCISINDKKDIWIGSDKDYFYVKNHGGTFKTYKLPQSPSVDANEISRIRFFNNETFIANKPCLTKYSADFSVKKYLISANDVLFDNGNLYFGSGLAYKLPYKLLEATIPKGFMKYEFIRRRTTIFEKGADNDIWSGTNFGLYYYNSTTDSPIFLGDKDEKLRATVKDILYDPVSKSVFVATTSQGVLEVKGQKVVRQFSKKNGLTSNSCNAIEKISDNYFLIGSNNGLSSISLNGNSIETKDLNAILGLKNKKINDIEFLDDIVYIVTDNGLLHFDIRNIERRKIVPICYIQNLIHQERNIEQPGNHKFAFENNDVSINYIGISYNDEKNLTYFYKLDGHDKHSTASKETQINYKSLAPGKYCFQVYCQDGFGVKSLVKEIRFEILAPFWQKTWFVVLVIILFSFLLYTYVKSRLKQQQRRFEKEKGIIQMERDKANLERQMIDLEQKALRLQMNPHFIFNALNTIKGYYSEGDTVNASNYISRFSKLLRKLLESTDQIIPLSNEIEMLDLYIGLTKTRYKNKFEYELFVDDALHQNETAIPTLLLQPIVENAIIHGLAPKEEKGILKVSFLKKGGRLECVIEDNGVGRAASKITQKNNKEYESKAIEITKERIALFGGTPSESSLEIIDLENHSAPSGTKVIITIPLISIW